MSGVCDFKASLNGAVFEVVGFTASGAAYLRAEVANTTQYIYHDLDCNGGGGGKARWIIGNHAPNTSKLVDLDDDGKCNYHARLDVALADSKLPPVRATWGVFCGSTWEPMVLNFVLQEERGANSSLMLNGACEGSSFFNGLIFDLQGKTASGSPYYKAMVNNEEKQSFYIYHDTACSGSAAPGEEAPVPRWILDESEPDAHRVKDLDADHKCEYHARTFEGGLSALPVSASWRMFCGTEWKDVILSFSADSHEAVVLQQGDFAVVAGAPLTSPLLALGLLSFSVLVRAF